MKKGLILYLFLFVGLSFSQTLLLEENFDFNGLLTNNGWTAHSSGGTNPISTTSGLTYSGYASSEIGNAAYLAANGEDVNRTFTTQSSGSVYVSFMLNVEACRTGYFLHFGTSTHHGRVHLVGTSSPFSIGLEKGPSSTIINSSVIFNTGSTYLLVLKYTFNPGAGDDVVSLFIFDGAIPSIEPTTPTLTNSTGTDVSSIGAIALRQYDNLQRIIVDGIRISDSWSQAPLPVELSSFSAIVLENSVKLNWRTETEVSNYGFEVERIQDYKNEKLQDWRKIGFVQGYGNSNSPKDYSFIDDLTLTPNLTHTFYYRLKQIDTDGQFEYSKVIEVEMGSPTKFELSQNYPNPFNPVTTIKFSIPQQGNVKLTVYNLLGEQVAELINGFREAGVHTFNFNAENLISGLYIYKIETNGIVQSRKMILLK